MCTDDYIKTFVLISVPEIHEPPDEKLVTWLKENGLDEESIHKVNTPTYRFILV